MDSKFPHENTFTRLKISNIEGIGVFAIRPIPRGTDVFRDDIFGIRWLDKEIIEAVSDPNIVKLYEQFSIRRGDKYGCPINFNSMTVGWYLNEPRFDDAPNIVVDASYHFYASRNIDVGEELTVRYA